MLFEKQEYQENCVNNIISLLSEYDFKQNSEQLLKSNLNSFHKDNPMPIQGFSGKLNIDILMETGTGKTFTYIKTIYELNKEYNINKFIIFVPRKAIREGVIENIKLTSNYFNEEYNKRLVKYTFDGKASLTAIQNHYIENQDELSVLILTNSSIDKDSNILRSMQENMFGFKSVLGAIQKIRPIVFIDEPHLLKGEAFTKIFNQFNSLYFRFGATFPKEEDHKLTNMIYSLDSISSFKNYLVKKIRVNTIITRESQLKVYRASKKEIELLFFKCDEERKITVVIGEDIGIKTGLDEYKGVHAVTSNSTSVYLSNNTELTVDTNYILSDDEIRLMIRKTIELHFEKEESFFNNGVKTLSLFFIPSIADFRGEHPRIKTIFEDEYSKQRKNILKKTTNNKYKDYLKKDIDKEGKLTVHEGYFSGDKGNNDDDKISNGIDIILSDKEKLLSFDSSLRFIFSVWALQEGWDNPNVFNICKLSQTNKETSRRQQIGRGLRICVNQEGKRLTHKYFDENENSFYHYNTLDVIVSGREANFIEEIQNEINENSFILHGDILPKDCFMREQIGLNQSQNNRLTILLEDKGSIKLLDDGEYKIVSPLLACIKEHKTDILNFLEEQLFDKLCSALSNYSTKSFVENANKKVKTVTIRSDKLKLFKELWETINRKAKIVYKDIEEESLINSIVEIFNKENIPEVHVKYEVNEFNAQTNTIEHKKSEDLEIIKYLKGNRYKEFVLSFAKEELWPLSFVLKIFNSLNKDKVLGNPREAKRRLKAIVKEAIHKNIIQSVSYELESEIKITTLQNEDGTYKSVLKQGESGIEQFSEEEKAPPHFLYDKIVFDSNIEKYAIQNDPETINGESITVFAKLPYISIPTPYKSYNPDFAYLVTRNTGKTLFLIVETKGYDKESDIPKEELEKIDYAKKFFKKLDEVTDDNIEIVFRSRINKQELNDLLRSIKG